MFEISWILIVSSKHGLCPRIPQAQPQLIKLIWICRKCQEVYRIADRENEGRGRKTLLWRRDGKYFRNELVVWRFCQCFSTLNFEICSSWDLLGIHTHRQVKVRICNNFLFLFFSRLFCLNFFLPFLSPLQSTFELKVIF